MEEFERRVEPTTGKVGEALVGIADWFIDRYKASQQKYDQLVKEFTEKTGLPFVEPPIVGIERVGPRVFRLLQRATRRGVSPKTIQRILRIKEERLVPALTETAERLSRIKSVKPPKINLDRIQAPDEIKQNIINWTRENAQYLSEQYPHHTFAEVKAELEKEGLNISKAMRTLKKVFGGDSKQILVALKGVRDAAVTVEREIINLQKAIRAEKNPDKIISLTAQLKEKQLLRDGLWEAVAGSGRVSGQLLAFRRMIAKSLKGSILDQRETLRKILGKRFEVGSPQYERFITALKNLNPEEPKEVINFLRQVQAPSIWDFPASIWYNSVLSSPKTHLVNLLGNTLFGTVESLVVRPISFLLDIPISKLTGIPRNYTKKEIIGYYGGLLRGLKIGTERFFRTLWTGFDPEEILYPSKWEQLRQSPWGAEFVKIPGIGIKKIPKLIQPILRGAETPITLPTRLLKAADVWFKGVFEEAKKFERAFPRVWNENKTLRQVILEADEMARTDPTLLDEAVQFGRWMTFQDAPGKVTNAIIRLREGFPGIRYIIPFVNIASNLMKRGFIDYAPPGLAKGVYQVVVKDPKAAETVARGLVGTIITLAGAIKYLEGDLILEPPRTKAERDAFYRQGKQPWSIKFGDRYVGIRRVEPFIYPFFIGALIVDALQKGRMNENKAIETLGNAVQKIGEFATDASYLYGLNRLWEAFNADWSEKGEPLLRWVDSVSVGFLPYASALRSIATAINPEVPEPTNEFVQAIKSILPWTRKEVKKRLTVWGEPAKYVTGAPGTFLPIATSEVTSDSVELELERLDHVIGFPSRVIQGRKLDDATYRIYLRISGRMARLAIDKLIHHPFYVQADDNTKRKLIDAVVEETRRATREALFEKFKIYKFYYEMFRNMGFDREKSEFMADKAFDKFMSQSAR